MAPVLCIPFNSFYLQMKRKIDTRISTPTGKSSAIKLIHKIIQIGLELEMIIFDKCEIPR